MDTPATPRDGPTAERKPGRGAPCRVARRPDHAATSLRSRGRAASAKRLLGRTARQTLLQGPTAGATLLPGPPTGVTLFPDRTAFAWLMPLALTLLLALTLAPPAGADPAPSSHVQVSPLLSPLQTYAVRFDDVGTYLYHCHPHPSMMGRLDVAPAVGAPQDHVVRIVDEGNATDATTLGFLDAETGTNVTLLHAGDTVTWVNEGRLRHDVAIAGPAAAPTGSAFEFWVLGAALVAVGGILFLRLRRPA